MSKLNFSLLTFLIIYFTLLRQSTYSSIEPGASFETTILSKNHYWFEMGGKLYLLRFINNLRFQDDPFIFIILIPRVEKENWLDTENCWLLKVAFNSFRTISAFSPLFSKKHSREFYKESLFVYTSAIQIKVKLENSVLFISSTFVINELKNYIYFLDFVEIGVRSWTEFYKDQDRFYGLFLQAYYVTYPENSTNKDSGCFFRIGNVIEILFVTFQAKTAEEKMFLESMNSFKETDFVKKDKYVLKNELVFELGNTKIFHKFIF